MADGFIVRKGGGGAEQALAPTITKVSEDGSSVTFTITNNDENTAVILYEIGDTTPDANSVEIAGNTTSGNLTISGLNRNVTLVLYASASVTGKIKSNVVDITYNPILFTSATGGTTLEYNLSGKRYRSHTFTSNGTFTVTTVGDNIDDRNKVDFLVLAGGGSGSNDGGGGGAGGYQTSSGTSGANSAALPKITVNAQPYSIVVGAGGAGGGGGQNGSNSSALGIVSAGGGRAVNSGGSGGGGNNGPGAAGTAGQGRNGGSGISGAEFLAGGGGGGASGLGGNATTSNCGNGGGGLANSLRTGSNETRAVGGGGIYFNVNGTSFFCAGGGGGQPAPANSGNGSSQGATAASGIVIIRYEIAPV